MPLRAADGATLADAVAASAIVERLRLDAARAAATRSSASARRPATPLADGDRVELTRPLRRRRQGGRGAQRANATPRRAQIARSQSRSVDPARGNRRQYGDDSASLARFAGRGRCACAAALARCAARPAAAAAAASDAPTSRRGAGSPHAPAPCCAEGAGRGDLRAGPHRRRLPFRRRNARRAASIAAASSATCFRRRPASRCRARRRRWASSARASTRVDLVPGDLVFFNTRHFINSHVGIYLGDNRFVHAPSRGSEVGSRRSTMRTGASASMARAGWSACCPGGDGAGASAGPRARHEYRAARRRRRHAVAGEALAQRRPDAVAAWRGRAAIRAARPAGRNSSHAARCTDRADPAKLAGCVRGAGDRSQIAGGSAIGAGPGQAAIGARVVSPAAVPTPLNRGQIVSPAAAPTPLKSGSDRFAGGGADSNSFRNADPD